MDTVQHNNQYHQLTVRDIQPETKQAVALSFDVPDELKNEFIVTPGQYVKLKTKIDDEEIERFYSICDFNDDFVQVGIKRVEEGIFSNYVCDNVKTGDVIEVQVPQGDFCLPKPEEIVAEQHYLFIAAGSGITPSLAMIKSLLTNYDNIDVNLIYVNTRRNQIMFFDQLEELKNCYMGRLNVIHVLTREPRGIPILSKRPDEDSASAIIDGLVGTDIDHTYMCGPLPMIELFRKVLLDRGIAKKSIHMELFGTPTVGGAKKKKAEVNVPYYQLAVNNVQPETAQAVSLSFKIPDELKEKFVVIPGQYVKLKTNIDNEEVERYYSICDFDDDFVQVGIKRVDEGVFSNYACDNIKVGDVLSLQAPQGDFCLPTSEEITADQRYLFVAAGSGITPSLAMIKGLLNNHDNIDVNLVYVNTRRNQIMFFDQLEALKNTHMGRFNVIHVLTREPRGIPILSRRPDEESTAAIIDGLVGNNIDHTYMCGPLPMIELFRKVLLDRGIEKKYIHMELFGTPTAGGAKKKNAGVDKSIKTKDITIINQGVEQVIQIREDQDILDAALEHGINVPYACKGGVCATCKAKCSDGTSDMVLNYGLEDDEVERGLVLTCQTYVTSETASFDFDVQ